MTYSYILSQINGQTYNLKIKGKHNNILYNTITNIIKTAIITKDELVFVAENVISFSDYIKKYNSSHSKCIKLIDDISKQIFYIQRLGYCFYGFDINDILVIDDTFILCNTKYLLPLEDEYIYFLSPFEKPNFSSPELIKLSKLPSKVHYKCSYYSLGLLVIFYIFLELNTSKEIEDILKPIYNTKIYWFLKRCLNEVTNKRILLLI